MKNKIKIKIFFFLFFVFTGCNNPAVEENKVITLKDENGNIKEQIILNKNDTLEVRTYNKGKLYRIYYYKNNKVVRHKRFYQNGKLNNDVYYKNGIGIEEFVYYPTGSIKVIVDYINDISYLATAYYYDTLNCIVGFERKGEHLIPTYNIYFKDNSNEVDTNKSFGYIIKSKDTIMKGSDYNMKLQLLDYDYKVSTFFEIIIGKIKDTSFNIIDTIYWDSGDKKRFDITIPDNFDIGYNYITGVIKNASKDTAGIIHYSEMKFFHDFWVSEDYESKEYSLDPPLPEINKKILFVSVPQAKK